ncbi:MAG TPA: ATP-binding protein [Chitinophagaceae bacterium]|nr:ATP-binding protein [Chitinophagaceae bacterium]
MIEQLFDNAPCGYFSFFDDRSIFLTNETFCSLTGYTKEELAGKDVETVFTIATRIFFQTHFFPMLKMHGQAEEIFITLLAKDKQHLPVLLNAKRLAWQERQLTSCAFIVVPNRKKFEDELVAARKAAETALRENSELVKARTELEQYAAELDKQMQLVNNQNLELKQFSHVVTHNLKEPLRKIILYADRLHSEQPVHAGEKDIARIHKAAFQLKNVVDALQQYVWLTESAPAFSAVNLSDTLQAVLEQLRGERPELPLEIQSNHLPEIEGEAGQLQLLLYHLLHNAAKFKKGDIARVKITGTVVKRNTYREMENKYRYEDFLRLEIRDEGIGFDPAHKHSLFRLFQKLQYGEGRGIGLALCRIIVNNHHGSIEADGELNKFAVFTVWLPMKQAHV